MRSAWKSDIGLVRENNEDAVGVDEANGLFLLADGMGGGPGGEVASNLAVSTASEWLMRNLAEAESTEIGKLLTAALSAAHSAIARRALADPSLAGMGTTLEIVLVREAEASVCHVGDSRVYLFRERLRRITTDDNYAEYLAKRAKIAPERIPSGYRHILTQGVGVTEKLEPEIQTLGLEPGDLLMICSDGLTEALDDQEIEVLIKKNRTDLSAITDALVDAANAKGGPDNITVVVIEPLQFTEAV